MKKNILIICCIILSSIIAIIIFSKVLKEDNNSYPNIELNLETIEKIYMYLDNETDDIVNIQKGKSFSAFEFLGAEKNFIYLYIFKADFYDRQNYTNSVILPVRLTVKIDQDDIKIIKHQYPEDGINYIKSLKKIFPSNIFEAYGRVTNNEKHKKLIEIACKRAKEFFDNNGIYKTG